MQPTFPVNVRVCIYVHILCPWIFNKPFNKNKTNKKSTTHAIPSNIQVDSEQIYLYRSEWKSLRVAPELFYECIKIYHDIQVSKVTFLQLL